MSQSNGFTAFSVYDEQPGEGVLSVTIYINGNQLDSKYRLSSVWVRKEVNKIGKAELVFKAWSTIESGEDTDGDNAEFTPGNSIRIEAGYLNTTPEASIFEGIIISDAMGMKGVVKYFKDGEADVMGVIAGNDILELSENSKRAVKMVKQAIIDQRLSIERIDESVKKILTAKYWAGLNMPQPVSETNVAAEVVENTD